ncbi:MAG: Trp biosynthesis-associated membrane protein [Propioniciclava sp.]|uniref:Trp biosynthesis-associated membrane protein n=1 Tax=Propioniciclava sp. TaxID=2038686 RepID=UPI0039E62ACB
MRIDPRAALAAAGLAGLAAGTQLPWWTVTWSSGFGSGSAPLTGQAGTSGLASALPVFVLAAVLLTLSLGPRGRRIVGVLTALAGLGMVAAGLTVPAPGDALIAQTIVEAGIANERVAAATGGALGYAAAGALVAAASVWLVAKPPASRRKRNAGEPVDVTSALDSWKAMDQGLDPTDDERGGA